MTALCQLVADWRGVLPPGGALASEKIDGWRALWFTGLDGVARLWTRGGIPIEGTAHIAHHCARLERLAGEPLFLDGEFQVAGSLAATKAWCERGWKQGGEAGQLFLFDGMPLDEWRAGGSPTPLYRRSEWLSALARSAEAECEWTWRERSHGRDELLPPVVVVPDVWAEDAGDALRIAGEIWARNGEGAVLKCPESPYQRKRSPDWMKVKQENAHLWGWEMAA